MVIWVEKAQKTQQRPVRIKNWNEPRMTKERKWVEDAQKDEMGQGSPKQHEYQSNDNTRPLKLSKGKAYSTPKRGPVSMG